MDLNLLFGVILVSVVAGLLCGILLMRIYRGTTSFKDRFYAFLLCCLLAVIFFGFYAAISGVAYYLYYVIAFFGVSAPVAVMLLPNWFGVYSKKK